VKLYAQVEIKEYVNILGTHKKTTLFSNSSRFFFKNLSDSCDWAELNEFSQKENNTKSFRHFFENSEVVKEIVLFLLDKSNSWTKEAEEEQCESMVYKVCNFCYVMSTHTCLKKRILRFQWPPRIRRANVKTTLSIKTSISSFVVHKDAEVLYYVVLSR